MTVGVGIIGCGFIGKKRALSLPTGARLVACFDIDADRALNLARVAGGETVASAEQLVAHPDVDLVVVATTHDLLPELGMLAVQAGRHVLLEKPGADRVAPLRSLQQAADSAGVVVRVGFNHRFHPALLRTRDIVRSGDFGPLLFVRARYGHGGRIGYEQEWRADRARSGGGELVDQGSHLLDLVGWLFGPSELAFAEARTAFWDMPVEDNAFIALRPASGGFAWLHASWTEWKNIFSFEIMLERAKLEISGIGGSYGPERLTLWEMQPEMGPPPATTWEYPATDTSWTLEFEDVLAELAQPTNTDRLATGACIADALATLALIEEAYRS